MFHVQTPNYVEHLANITQAATDFNAANDEINKEDPVHGVWYLHDGQPLDSINYMNVHESFLDSIDAVKQIYYDGQNYSDSIYVIPN